jgi:hypothetical protein
VVKVRVLELVPQMIKHSIARMEPSVIISQAKRVGTQMVVLLVQHVHHPNGSAKYDDFKFIYCLNILIKQHF